MVLLPGPLRRLKPDCQPGFITPDPEDPWLSLELSDFQSFCNCCKNKCLIKFI